jgi:HEAT repeat protein
MKSQSRAAALALGLVLAWAAFMPSPARALEAGNYRTFDRALREVLLDLGMKPEDMRIRLDYAEPDKFRLTLVDSLMRNPESLLEQVDGLARKLENSAAMSALCSTMWQAMDVEPTAAAASPPPGEVRDVAGRLRRLPADTRLHIERYAADLGLLAGLLARARGGLGPDTGFLETQAPSLVKPQAEYDDLGPFELHDLEELETALADSVLRLSELVELPDLAGMCVLAMRGAESTAAGLRPGAGSGAAGDRYGRAAADFNGMECRVTGGIAYMGMTPYGPVVIGGHGDNTYSGCFALIADPGGNDTYALLDHPDVNFRLIIDYAGDDMYASPDQAGVAGVVFGTSVLIDFGGDDTYRGGNLSLGSAIYGGAVLYDAGGDDIYEAGTFSQGAGFLGVGALVDAGGNDNYVAAMQSQGFGYVMGSGLILDRDGNDTYYTRMSQKDILRYEDHYLTLSQGCAFGSRPDYSGGIGLLIDQRGNDLYYSDIFGQGVGYWFCVGGLIDRHGHDYYCSYQYAQGSGVHLAFGLLLDEQGNDFYQSKGVSQGCGHDLSLGLLADFSGNDCYTVTDLSQGAGNANGTGIIFDADGADSYSSKSMVNVNGYGNYRREFGSIGLQMDMAGGDFYSARGRNDALWESGRYGLGIDVPGESTRPEGDILIDEMELVEEDYTPEQLFILASRGEPRFRQWQKYGFDRMVEDTAATIGYLRGVLDTDVARERHTIKDILLKIGAPAVPMLSRAVLEDNDAAKSEASWVLGLIGEPAAFDALIVLSRDRGWKQRSSAVNALAKLDGLSAEQVGRLMERVDEILADDGEVFYVRKDAAYAAGRQGLTGALPLLVQSLESDHYSVRFAAAEAMRGMSADHGDAVFESLYARLDSLSNLALTDAIYAAGNLTDGRKLAVADAVLESDRAGDMHVGVALARLLGGVADTKAGLKRQERLLAAQPAGSWEVQAVLEGP